MIRQGDVLLVEATIPVGAHPVRRKDQGYPKSVTGIVLAAGEATGHHHRAGGRSGRGRLFTRDGRRYLRVGKRGVELEHEEHGTIQIPEGEYEIRGQREYEPPTRAATRPSSRRVFD